MEKSTITIITCMVSIVLQFVTLFISLFANIDLRSKFSSGEYIISTNFVFIILLIPSLCLFLTTIYLACTGKTLPTKSGMRADGRKAMIDSGIASIMLSILFMITCMTYNEMIILIFIILVISGIIPIIMGMVIKEDS